MPGEAPYLADIGPWHGSFDVVPAPILEDGVVWSMLHPGTAVAGSGGESSQGPAGGVGAENAGTDQGCELGAGNDTEWNGDFFDRFLKNEGGDEGFFGMNHDE